MLLSQHFVVNQPHILTNVLPTTFRTGMGSNVNHDTVAQQNTSPPELRKIFLGGLRYTETEETIKAHFEKFGSVENVLLPREKGTGKPRGFGFVTFKDEGIAQSLAGKESHTFNGRLLDIKLAVPRNDPPPGEEVMTNADMGPRTSGTNPFPGLLEVHNPPNATTDLEHRDISSSSSQEEGDDKFLPNRIFVGGLPDGVTNSVLREYFSKFGTVLDSFVLLHSVTKRPRGFGFVTFKEEEVVPVVISYPNHIILGKKVETRLATTRSERRDPTSSPNIQRVPSSISTDSTNNVFNPMMKPRPVNRIPFAMQQNQLQMLPNQMINPGMMQLPYNAAPNSVPSQAALFYYRQGTPPMNLNFPAMMKHQQQFYAPGTASINYTATYDPNATPYYSISGVSTFVGGQMPMNLDMQQQQFAPMHQHSNSSSSNETSPPGSTAQMGAYFDQP